MSALPLPALFARALSTASKAYNLPTDLIQASLTDLSELNSRISGLSLFSPNEFLEDISTRDLTYLLVPYVIAEVHGRVRTATREDRLVSLNLSQTCLEAYLSNLENYEIIPDSEQDLHSKKTANVENPASRRELKMQQYRQEKDLRARIEVIRKRRRQTPIDPSDISSDFALITSLLPSSPSQTAQSSGQQDADEDSDEDSSTEDVLREAVLLLLRLMHAQAHASLASMVQELELLKTAPPPSAFIEEQAPGEAEDARRAGAGKKNSDDPDMWKLDSPVTRAPGPLLNPQGKPLRPFTILPSGAADRARIQAGVFGPGHNLPTMSIDEYLQIEQERGGIITGGGAASEAALTTSEQLQLDSEFDGTSFAEERSEAKRQKDENWARYTDENAKGAGNTMNRG